MESARTCILGMSDAAWKAIEEGSAFRSGGVIYWKSGGILEHLQDIDVQNGLDKVKALCGFNVVPLAFMGISMLAINHRLQNIERTLKEIQHELKNISMNTEMVHLQAKNESFGRLFGAIHDCQLDVRKGKTDLSAHRKSFLQAYYEFMGIANDIINKPELLRHHGNMCLQYCNAMFLAGIAARDASYRMGDRQDAHELSKSISEQAQGLAAAMKSTLSSPAAAFWRKDEHISMTLEVREAAARLASHVESISRLPEEKIQITLTRQCDH